MLFDDFNYTNTQQLEQQGWILRSAPGWPGIPGATWGGISVPGGGIVRMTSSTDGTPANTHQTQLCHQRKYLDGTYAARVRFTDAPVAGPNGDQVVETFYMISPIKKALDPVYGEADFEYLPNGGWGKTGPTFFFTTWYTFQLEPWIADNMSTNIAGALDGWHTLVVQMGNGNVTYFVDGKQTAQHGGKFYPRSIMSLNFNLWFVRGGTLVSPDTRTYIEDIDWVYHRADKVLTPEAVEAEVANLRRTQVAFRDTVPDRGLSSPCNF
ncbi:MAG TPA: glycoside hydrolase family 16 protein [Thermoanaerobaculia bacterium]|nr:glycoside hydrolase family 16 protein [Thermoanaerobaculia bacterium]